MTTTLTYPSGLDHIFQGNVRVNGNLYPPAGSIGNTEIEAGAAIDATKLIHQFPISYAQANGSDVASATQLLHVFRGAATILSVEVVPATAPTGGDKQFTVDFKLGNAGSGFATILSGVITVDSSSVTRTVQTGTLTTTAAADGDTLEVVITASGSTGSQGQGFVTTCFVSEAPS